MSIYSKIKTFICDQQSKLLIRKKTSMATTKPEDVICAIPWIHLNLEPNGKVVPCCLTSHYNYFSGDLTTDSIEEIWNSDNMKSLRKEMINGIEPKICATCFNRERITGESGRVYHNREFKSEL